MMNPRYDRLAQAQVGLVRYLRLKTQKHQNSMNIFQLQTALAQEQQQVRRLHGKLQDVAETSARAHVNDYVARLSRFDR